MRYKWKDPKQDQWIREELRREAERIERAAEHVVLEEEPGDQEKLFERILEAVREEELRTGKRLLEDGKERETGKSGAAGRTEEAVHAGEGAGFAVVRLAAGGAREKKPSRRRILPLLRAASVFLVACVGIFGISMTSEGNRLWVMERIAQVFESGENVNLDNDGNREISDVTEREAREEIEKELGIPVPEFFYLPEGTEFWKYQIDNEAGMVNMEYLLEDGTILTLAVANSMEDKSSGSIYDGTAEKNEKIQVGERKFILAEKLNNGKELIVTAQWQYKNHSYEMGGMLSKDEMIKILEEMKY